MSTRQLIDNIVCDYPMGDVEDYFEHMNTVSQLNSGNNSYHMATHVAHTAPAPLADGRQQTHFYLTDSSMDIVDISKGLISLKIKVDCEFRLGNQETELIGKTLYETYYRNCAYFFVGFKSGSHIIKHYSIKTYGQNNDCDQRLALQEQTIMYNCKAESERASRPGLYSPHDEVMKMSDCVCGCYIQQPILTGMTTKMAPLEFEVLIQVDDLAPLTGFKLYPQCICNELQLAIQCDIQKNMVFCPIPIDVVFEKRMFTEAVDLNKEFIAQFADGTGDNDKPSLISTFAYNTTAIRNTQNMYTDFRFTQCGDYAKACLGVTADQAQQKSNITAEGIMAGNRAYYTIVPTHFSIEKAESYVYGFGLRETAKAHLLKIFKEHGAIKIPAQWIDATQFPQQPNTTNINANTNKSLFECDQIVLTFPNTDNQMTVSRNPHFQTFHVSIGNRINIPDLQMSTCEKNFTEMTLSALSLDTIFTAPKSLINALNQNPNQVNNKFYGVCKEDDSDFMIVCDLERGGAGIVNDGVSGINVPIRVDATYMQSTNNPHYFEYDGNNGTYNLRKVVPNLFTVSDACWLLTENGPIFVKDANKRELTLQAERKAQEEMITFMNALYANQIKRSADFENV